MRNIQAGCLETSLILGGHGVPQTAGTLVTSADDHSCQEFLPTAYEGIPDVRDGLSRRERVVLYVLHETQKERGGRNVPTAMLWGRVCEHFYISPEELSEMLARLGARR